LSVALPDRNYLEKAVYCHCFSTLEAYDVSLLDEGTDNIQNNSTAIKHYLEYAVVKFVEALRYKPEGRGFDSR
jgi:hypothetical protein